LVKPSKVFDAYSVLETNRYHFFKTDIFKKNFTDICPAADIWWPRLPIFQNLLTDIFADILTKYIGYVGVDCLQAA